MKIIDLHFMGTAKSIGVYLFETDIGPVLFEAGPFSCIEYLEKGLAESGYTADDIKHVFLTHIHLDHAGAAWYFAEKGATIYVHPKGFKHLVDPTKLVASATKIYGDQMELLWGKFGPIEENKIVIVDHLEEIKIGDKTIKSLHTPGHAVHHTAWQTDEGIVCGDVAGIRIDKGPPMPPCPPPDINFEDWSASLDILIKENPSVMYIAHYGVYDDAVDHLTSLKKELKIWDEFVSKLYQKEPVAKLAVSDFDEWIEARLLSLTDSNALTDLYSIANPPWITIHGLYRYYYKKGSS